MFRVGTDRSHGNELLDTGTTRFFHQVDAHRGVVVEVLARVLSICSDASHNGCQMDYHVRMRLGQQSANRFRLPQVPVGGTRHNRFFRRVPLEQLANVATKETGTTGYHDSTVC